MAVTEVSQAVNPAESRDPIPALTQHVVDARKDIAALKAVVATQAHLKEMEGRINERLDEWLDRLETKIDTILNLLAEQ